MSADIMDDARRIAQESRETLLRVKAHPNDFFLYLAVVDCIGRAIMAERERCARIAENWDTADELPQLAAAIMGHALDGEGVPDDFPIEKLNIPTKGKNALILNGGYKTAGELRALLGTFEGERALLRTPNYGAVAHRALKRALKFQVGPLP